MPLYFRKSRRLQWYDYSTEGAYFVTINTKQKQKYFGKISNSSVELSEAGKIATGIWQLIPEQFNNSSIGEFCVMPDHLHGIIFLHDHKFMEPVKLPPNAGGITGAKNPMLYENLSRIIRWFKGRATFEIRKAGFVFDWQDRFDDRIIRSLESLERVTTYIRQNPANAEKT